MSAKPKPRPFTNVGLYRAQLSCKITRDIIEGETDTPDGVTPVEWALFNLAYAIEDIAKAMEENMKENKKDTQ